MGLSAIKRMEAVIVGFWEKSSLTLPSPVQGELRTLIEQHAKPVTIPADRVFLEPGDMMNGVYFIADGRTRHYMVDENGTEKTLYTLASGWFYGEAVNTLREPTGLYACTEVQTVLYHIPTSDFEWLLDNVKLFREAILQSHSKKVLILCHEVENLAFNSCKDRLKRLFRSAADPQERTADGWYRLKIKYTQYEMGTIVGCSRVTVNKLMNELCDEGFIRILNRNIQINGKELERFL